MKDLVSSVTVYDTQLRGFERVTLDPGQDTISPLYPEARRPAAVGQKHGLDGGARGV